ncbi:NAD(P)-dependent iron-only hydrogenase diaphorase component iron-sulfur protein [Clostridium sp. DSM 8431]|uniref:NADH-quinone oxidoreductase subunit NuoE family protein n=1 Tax=Clostridium sp. DSM 8431 TaxID=1761781 RepID=UPI0008EA5C80|nr:NAD(P)H-dependent oxidoreductase subunit E [Clostridium sp. DSM 8431]SFU72521.1 NAD(P)-dependent iron-only hydrogenase diaphorase component iron-sulfur protein [Clostridium sp. DSM 8431]
MTFCGHNYREIDSFIDNIQSKKGALIEVLHYVQDMYGYIDIDMQEHISEKMNIPKSKIYGVISFYSYFTTEAKGEHVISVCTGTACFVKGSHEILEEFKKILKINPGETTADGKFTLNTLRCVGACGLAPIVSVGDKLYGRFKKEDVRKVIMEFSEEKHGSN